MSFLGVDRRGLAATAGGIVGDDVRVTVSLMDLTSGAVTGTGATIVATVDGTEMTVDYSVTGLFVCSLTDTQTTAIGVGAKAWIFRLTPAGGDRQTYVSGTMTLSTAGVVSSPQGSSGWQAGIVGNVLVGIS